MHNETIYILATDKEDVSKIKILEITKDNVQTHSIHDSIQTKSSYADEILSNLKMISHKKGLLIFVSEKVDNEQINNEIVPTKIVYFEDFNIDNPKIIKYQNSIEPKEDEWGKMHTGFETIGYSDTNIFPVILNGYRGYHIGFQMALLAIDFDKLTANWQTEKQKKLIEYKKKKYVFEAVQYKNNKINYFTIGNSYRYLRHGMSGKIHLGTIANELEKPKFSVIYNCEYDKKSTKLFGRNALFTSSQQYCIIKPLFAKHDPWGKREKLYDLNKNELVDIVLPRGFANHHIINANDSCFLSFGKNSKKEDLLTVFTRNN